MRPVVEVLTDTEEVAQEAATEEVAQEAATEEMYALTRRYMGLTRQIVDWHVVSVPAVVERAG